MPIYEYKCLGCGAHSEKMQKVSDEPLTVCEKCDGVLEKQWSLSGFQFKGAGWYVTDYSAKGNEKTAESAAKTEKSEKDDVAEKTSAPESTVKTETASNKTKDDAASAKETVVKKD